MKFLKAPIVLMLALLLVPAVASAQNEKQVKKAEDLNRKAMEDYDLLEFESAKKQLNEALVVIKKNKLEKHAVAARTHMNLGIVYGGGLNDEDTALLEFIAAVEIDPDLSLDPAYKNKALQALFDQARQTVGVSAPPKGGGGDGGGGGDPDITGIQHTSVDEAKGGDGIPINVQVGADVKAKQVVLYYRPQGSEDFTPIVMKSDDGTSYSGEIPSKATSGESLHYYIEAKNDKGKVVATVGNVGSPNIVMIEGGAPPIGDGMDDEDPFKGRGGGGGGGGGGGDDDGVIKVAGAKKKSVFVNASVGTGGGYVSGKTEVSAQTVGCCVAPAPFHVVAEVGFYLNPRLALSGWFRMGFAFADAEVNGARAATAAPAGFLRLAYSLDAAGGGLQVHGDLGGGFIRHQIPLKKTEDSMVDGSTDTSAAGPLFIGGGAKWEKPLGGDSLRFLADLSVLAGIPVTDQIGNAKLGFALHADVTIGFAVAF